MITEIMLLACLGTLAVWQITETVHHGSIFANFRAYFETQEGFFADLILCSFCFSHWAGFFVTAIILPVAVLDTGAHWIWLTMFPVISLAMTRLAQLLNDLTHSKCRTPRIQYDTTHDLMEEFNDIGTGLDHEPDQPEPGQDLIETKVV